MSQQQAQYLTLLLTLLIFINLTLWLSIHFIWGALVCALGISQSVITGWLPFFKHSSLTNKPSHNLRSIFSSPKILKVTENSDIQPSALSFASYQKLQYVLNKHQKSLSNLSSR